MLDQAGHLLLVRVWVHRDRVLGHHVHDRRIEVRDEQLAQVDHSQQPVASVKDVQVIGLLHHRLAQAQEGDRLLGRHLWVQGHVATGHQAPGALVGVLQERRYLLGGRHGGQHARHLRWA